MKKLPLLTIVLLFVTVMLSCSKSEDPSSPDPDDPPGNDIRTPTPFSQLPASSRELTVPGPQFYIDVMGNQRSKLPKFKKVDVRSGYLRGYVKDIYGRPLQDAQIGIRSSLVGGTYSSASGHTDATGYYEILLPAGAVEFWGTSYRMDYESGKAPVSLFPADSNLNSFTSINGAVKNFVLLPYGHSKPERVTSDPYWPSSYLGGSIHLSYTLRTQSLPLPGSFPVGTVIQIRLTPLDLVHADEKISFTIRKVIGSDELYINNIPLGRYKLEIRLENGTDIEMNENINLKPQFGMQPKQATGSTTVTFIPGNPEVLAWYGNWWIVPILIEHP